MDKIKKALNWWNNLTDHGRSRFPAPEDNDDILSYYTCPAEHICMDYGMCNF